MQQADRSSLQKHCGPAAQVIGNRCPLIRLSLGSRTPVPHTGPREVQRAVQLMRWRLSNNQFQKVMREARRLPGAPLEASRGPEADARGRAPRCQFYGGAHWRGSPGSVHGRGEDIGRHHGEHTWKSTAHWGRNGASCDAAFEEAPQRFPQWPICGEPQYSFFKNHSRFPSESLESPSSRPNRRRTDVQCRARHARWSVRGRPRAVSLRRCGQLGCRRFVLLGGRLR